MACYYGLETTPNKVMWATFVVFLVAGCVMLPLGLAKFVPCYNEYMDCLDRFPEFSENDWRNPCRPPFEDCAVTWARLVIVGAICLGIASVPQCYFCCCAKPPLKPDPAYQAQAVVMQPYPQPPGVYPVQPGVYPPGAYQPAFQPVPGGPQIGVPAAGQPYAPGTQFYPVAPQPYQYAAVPTPGYYGPPMPQQPEQQQQQQRPDSRS